MMKIESPLRTAFMGVIGYYLAMAVLTVALLILTVLLLAADRDEPVDTPAAYLKEPAAPVDIVIEEPAPAVDPASEWSDDFIFD